MRPLRGLLIAVLAVAAFAAFSHSARAQNANLNCLTATSSTGYPTWAPASAANPCPVTISGGSLTANTSANASSTPPTYTAGENPLSQTLSGGLRVDGSGVTLTTTLATGTNAVGTVGVTALPALPAGTNSIGKVTVTSGNISLPSAAGYAASNTTVAVSSGTPVTLFGAAGIANGCFIQNPASDAVALIVDWGGGTPASPVAPQSLAPGASANCMAAYTNQVNMWLASGSASVTVYAGRY
jgi:hypothetical protein